MIRSLRWSPSLLHLSPPINPSVIYHLTYWYRGIITTLSPAHPSIRQRKSKMDTELNAEHGQDSHSLSLAKKIASSRMMCAARSTLYATTTKFFNRYDYVVDSAPTPLSQSHDMMCYLSRCLLAFSLSSCSYFVD